jgi:hypothetical protein
VNFDEVDEARRLLSLSDTATLKEIKSAYRRLAHRHHPDKHGGGSDEAEVMKKLNWAYKLLMGYCDDYKYSFKEEDVARTYPYDEYLRKYANRWFDYI